MAGRFCYTNLLAFIAVAPSFPALGSSIRVLTSFNRMDGSAPFSGLIADHAGNLYGTTNAGGAFNLGTVFKLTPPPTGQTSWTETVLASLDGTWGANPYGGLLADSAGNLYGTTSLGGQSGKACGSDYCGTVVYKLAPPAAGQTTWTETVLASFEGTQGADPNAALIADSAGNLYGTTTYGGASGAGTVFKLTPPAAGQTAWTESVLVSFNETNGALPFAGLIADRAGNLYGTTEAGGASGAGTVFKLTPPAEGQTAWTETVLLSFNGTDGEGPRAALIADSAGNLYSTTPYSGSSGAGTVFKLAPPAAGQTDWTETVLLTFNGTKGIRGQTPAGALIADHAGNLYGTTTYGGAPKSICAPIGCGTVFKLAPPLAGKKAWTETILADFRGTNGADPYAGLVAGRGGSLYGTTTAGGAPGTACGDSCGTVFKVTR